MRSRAINEICSRSILLVVTPVLRITGVQEINANLYTVKSYNLSIGQKSAYVPVASMEIGYLFNWMICLTCRN